MQATFFQHDFEWLTARSVRVCIYRKLCQCADLSTLLRMCPLSWYKYGKPITAIPNLSERDPNLSLVDIAPPKPQTAHCNVKIMIACMIFGSKLPSSFSKSTVYSFLKYLRCWQAVLVLSKLWNNVFYYKHIQYFSATGEIEVSVESPRRDPFVDPSRPWPILR